MTGIVNSMDVPDKWRLQAILNKGSIVGYDTNCVEIENKKVFTAKQGWYTGHDDKIYYIDDLIILIELENKKVKIITGSNENEINWKLKALLNKGSIVGYDTNCVEIENKKVFTAKQGWYTGDDDKIYYIDDSTILVESENKKVNISKGNDIKIGNTIFKPFSH